MLKKIVLVGISIFLLPGMAIAAVAVDLATYGTGSRSTADGSLVAADGWSGTDNNGFQIAWSIALSGGTYTYGYTISGEGGSNLSKDLSHWLLQVTNPSLDTDFLNVSPLFSGDSPKTFEPSGVSTGDQPSMPANLYGIKWDAPSGTKTYSVSFETTKDPVWGDFYAKDGVQVIHLDSGNIQIAATAWNIGFGTDPTGSTDFTYWIPTPDGGEPTNGNGNGTHEPIPEPTILALFGLGSLGLFHLRKKN